MLGRLASTDFFLFTDFCWGLQLIAGGVQSGLETRIRLRTVSFARDTMFRDLLPDFRLPSSHD